MGRPRTDIQPRVLEAARRRYLESGVDGASLRTIAKDARTSIGMVFYYYPTKDALFFAVVEEAYAKLLEDLEAILARPKPVRERLRNAFVRIGSATAHETDVVRLVLREAIAGSPRFHDILARFRRGHVRMIMAALSAAASEGEIDASIPPPFMVAATFGMGGLPQVIRRIAGDVLPLGTDVEALADLSVRMLFDGIARKKRPRRQARRKGRS
jgi:AcrR family transcriptional regulator